MGQKTHPIGFRLGTTRDWSSHWFGASPKDYREQVMEDHNITALFILSDDKKPIGIVHLHDLLKSGIA